VQGQLPTAWIYFLSVKPAPLRWKHWDKQRRTNQMIEDFCQTKPQLQFVDKSSAMLDSPGQLRRDLFNWDGLHPSIRRDALWTSIVRPILCAGNLRNPGTVLLSSQRPV
jgi:hypothetical protein